MKKSSHPPLYDDKHYFTGHTDKYEQQAWDKGMIRYGDQCCAIGYAFGNPSFYAVRDILHFAETGKIPLPDTTAKKQIKKLYDNRKRTPKSVLDIGGGRGEISLSLAHCGIKTQMVEPANVVDELVAETKKKFHMRDEFNVLNGSLYESLPHLNKDIDTIIFSESIEHIPIDEFEFCIRKIRDIIKERNWMIIVVNWIDFHPIYCSDDGIEHCRMIDDKFYDYLTQGTKTSFRLGSHLVFSNQISAE